MSDDGVNTGRRRFLTAATTVVGAGGAVGVVVPFVGSWNPSAKAKAAGAPVKADVSKLEPGQMVVVEWRGKPVFIVRRTAEQLKVLEQEDPTLKDPSSATAVQPTYVGENTRSIKPEIMVVLGICTHLGCSPKFQPSTVVANAKEFFCPCHGSRFDMAGRVFKGYPASAKLEVPPYKFENDGVIVVGVDQGETA